MEWPIQVSRNPDAGGAARSARVDPYSGMLPAGARRTRSSLRKYERANRSMEPEGAVRALTGFLKTPSAKLGDRWMRSILSP